MIETEFKTLMHCGLYVDVNLLSKGIYTTSQPFIYPKETTIDGLIERGKQMKTMGGINFLPDVYFENLKQCKLVPIAIIAIH
jgi:hypothetical protein